MNAVLRTATLCMLLSAAASAQTSIQGLWAGEIQSNGDAQRLQMSIRVDDERVSGSIVGGGRELSIAESSLNGNVVEFTTTERRDGAQLKFRWTGTISANGTEISFSCAAEGQPATEFVVRRQG